MIAIKLTRLKWRKFRKDLYTMTKIDHTSLIEKSKLATLHDKRIRNLALETYKIINKDGPKFLRELVKLKQCNYFFGYNIADVKQAC